MIERISPPGANPRGPYSPAVRAGDFIFVSGQVAPKLSGDVRDETRQVLTSLKGVVEACGASMSDVVRSGVYLIDGADFAAMNEVYAEFFGNAKPARTTIIVAALPPPNAKVEIDLM